MGHLTFVSKCLSAVGNKRILQFFDSARERRSRVIAGHMPLFKVWSEDKLNKKFVVAENFVCIKGRALLTF